MKWDAKTTVWAILRYAKNCRPQPPGRTARPGTERTGAAAEAAELGDTQVSSAVSKSSIRRDKKRRSTRHLTCIFSIISNKAEVWREESEMKCLSWSVGCSGSFISAALRVVIRVRLSRCREPCHT